VLSESENRLFGVGSLSPTAPARWLGPGLVEMTHTEMKHKAVAVIVSGLSALTLAAVGAQEERAAPTGSVWDKVYTTEQAGRGGSLFAEHCSECHGADLRTPSGPAAGPPLAGPVFMSRWRDRSLEALFEQTRQEMPLGRGGLLSDHEYIDLIAHILDVNEFGAGPTELDPNAPALSEIVIRDEHNP